MYLNSFFYFNQIYIKKLPGYTHLRKCISFDVCFIMPKNGLVQYTVYICIYGAI